VGGSFTAYPGYYFDGTDWQPIDTDGA
jgi:hypothetical protein